MAEKSGRNMKIYEYVKSGIPQTSIAHFVGVSRQSISEIYARYCDKFGYPSPMTETITTVDLSPTEKQKLVAESKRIKASIATVIRLAINQSIIREGNNPIRPLDRRGTLKEKSSLTVATKEQFNHLTEIQEKENLNRAEALRLIINNYEPISINF